ncbi:MAG: ATP synthase F1 subunit epsilon [Alphaproteobacteria bacterium]|nr:ATP synthase F1 subunit epsilon [Alphaproteobacteria bacterium]
MAATLQFELVSPEKLLINKPVGMVTVPGGEGAYGVLVGHAPMITTVLPGVIDIYTNANDTAPSERLFVSGGFAEVTPERCTILADESLPVEELKREALQVEAQEVSAKLAATTDDNERSSLMVRQAVIEAKLQHAA